MAKGIWCSRRRWGWGVRRVRGKKALPDTAMVLMNFLITVSSRDVADLYFTPDLLLNTLFHGSNVSR